MKFIRATWPSIETPETSEKVWAQAFPGVDLLEIAKDCRNFEVTSRHYHANPAGFLHSRFRAAFEKRKPGATTGSSKSAQTIALERKTADDDRKEAEHRAKTAKPTAARRAFLAAVNTGKFGAAK